MSPAPIKRSSPSEEHSRYKRKPRPRDRDFNGPGCTAEDYAKLMGVRHPSMYHREPLCTPLISRRLHVPSTVKGQVDHTISRRCAAEYAPAARILCSTLRHGGRRAAAEARRARIGPWPRRPARSTRSMRPARVAAAAVAARAAIAPRPDSDLCARTPIRPAWPSSARAQSHGRQIAAACSLPAVHISRQPLARVNQQISLQKNLSHR